MTAAAEVEPAAPEQVVRITSAGVDALTDTFAPSECDLCRCSLRPGDAYYRVTLGMDETPSIIGAPLETETTVEDVSELVVCAGCQPSVAAPLERLLRVIWAMRGTDSASPDEPAPAAPTTERSS